MALAKFYDKAALAASHILRGFDEKAFANAISATPITLFFDKSAAESREGRWTLELAVNLLARLYPRISIVSEKQSELVSKLAKNARAINPQIEVDDEHTPSSVCLAVGNSLAPNSRSLVYIGSDGWITKISSKTPVGSADTGVPFGADAAACIGVANVFRTTFSDQLDDGRLDEMWQMSLLDFDPSSCQPANPLIGEVDFKDTHLVGIGAIGNGCVWSLSRMQNLRGELHLIDAQAIELSNLQRYVLAEDGTIGRLKVDIAKDFLSKTGLNVATHPHSWGTYLTKRNDWHLSRVAVAVDTAKDRQAIQAALPEWIVNAWTQVGDLGVSRHSFLGNQACLACLYLATGVTKNDDELVAESIGLLGETPQVRKMLFTNEPLTRAFITRIAEATKANLDKLLKFEGQPLRVFYSEAVCGGILLSLGANASMQRRVEIPMAFQSALAGIFMAAELVARGANLKSSPPPVTTKLDLLRPLGTYISLPAPKPTAGNCVCQDSDYVQVFTQKYLGEKVN